MMQARAHTHSHTHPLLLQVTRTVLLLLLVSCRVIPAALLDDDVLLRALKFKETN